MNPGRLFRRENIKTYEYLWVVLGAVVAHAVYDGARPERDRRWLFLLISCAWTSICSFKIYTALEERWQKALRTFNDALRAYDEDLFTAEEVLELKVWFWACSVAGLAGIVACLVL